MAKRILSLAMLCLVLFNISAMALNVQLARACEPTQCEVTFFTDPVCSEYYINFQCHDYYNGENGTFPYGFSGSATACCPEDWVFDHWEVSGNVVLSGETENPETENPTRVTVNCGGTLKAFFKLVFQPDDNVMLFFSSGAEIEDVTAEETTRYPPPPPPPQEGEVMAASETSPADGFIGLVWDIEVEGTFPGLARVRLYYGQTEVHPTVILQTDLIPGDVNADGVVNCKDLCLIIGALWSRPGRPRWNEYADLNGDGKITLRDVCIAICHWGETSEWTPLRNIEVNTGEQYIEGDTDHFSIFGAH